MWISIPVVRGGVQRELMAKYGLSQSISIPVVRGGVQPEKRQRIRLGLVYFNSRGAWGSSTRVCCSCRQIYGDFNSRGAWGSSTYLDTLNEHIGTEFQFPWCVGEFNQT